MNRRSLLRSTALLTSANLLLEIIGLLFQIYLSRALGAEGIGKLHLIFAAGGFALTVGISGFRVAAMNLTAAKCGSGDLPGMKKTIVACLVCSAVLSSCVAVLFVFLAPGISGRWLHDTQAVPALRVLGFGLPISCLTAVLGGYFTARGKIKPLICVEFAVQIISVLLTWLCLQFRAELHLDNIYLALVGSSTVASFLGLIPLLLLLWHDLRGIPSGKSASVAKQLAALCVPLALGDYLRAGLRTLEQFLIPMGLRQASGSAGAAMADYGTIGGMVFPVLMFPSVLFQSLSDLLVSELSRCKAQGQQFKIRRIVGGCLRTGLVFSAFIAGLMELLAPALGQLLYGSTTAGHYLRIFAPMVLVLYMDALTDGMLKGLGEQVAGVRYNTITAAMDVILLLFLLPKLGIYGYLISFSVTHVFNFYLSIRRLFWVTGYRTNLHHSVTTLLVLLISGLLCHRLSAPAPQCLSVVCCGLIFSGIFLLFSLPTGVLRPGDLRRFFPTKTQHGA